MTIDKKLDEARMMNYLIHEIPKYDSAAKLKGFKEGIERRDDVPEKDKQVLYPIINGFMRQYE